MAELEKKPTPIKKPQEPPVRIVQEGEDPDKSGTRIKKGS